MKFSFYSGGPWNLENNSKERTLFSNTSKN
jgi:hypothetical protein